MSNYNEIRYVTYKGLSEEECFKKLFSDFGRDIQYFVKNRKDHIKIGGFLGIGAKDGIEISFSVYRNNNLIQNAPIYGPSNNTQSINNANSLQNTETIEETKKKIIEKSGKLPIIQITEVLEEIKSLKAELTNKDNSSHIEEHPTIVRIQEILENNEFSLGYTKKIVDRLRKEYSVEKLDNYEEIQSNVLEWIKDSVQIKEPNYVASPQVVVLVGPTGVGKTTTVAKIAASYKLPQISNERKKNVAIITIDVYRVAAKEQIRHYADILGVPVFDCDTSEKLQNQLRFIRDSYDIILIDTIGFSPKDFKHLAEMREILEMQNFAVETYLTFAATTKLSDMREIMKQYEPFGYESVIVTKVDETTKIGNVISILDERKKSVVYIATGQKVPHNIEKATFLRFSKFLSDFKIDEKDI